MSGLSGDLGPPVFLGAKVTHVPTFAPIRFKAARINGLRLIDFAPSRYNLTSARYVQIQTGPLSPRGDRFTTNFAHN